MKTNRHLLLLFLLFSISVFAQKPSSCFDGAVWVGATDDPKDSLGTKSIEIIKPFTLRQPADSIREAVLYVCGLGHYIAEINGERLSDAEFAPLWSDYDKTVYYNVLNIQETLNSSIINNNSSIGITLGNGMYNVRKDGRYAKFQRSYGAPKLIMVLAITYNDGTRQTVRTDGTEQWRRSPIVFNSIYGGESYDENLENQPLRPVMKVSAPAGRLVEQTAPPVKVMERFGVRQWRRLGDRIVCDMGQNLSGFPELTLTNTKGGQTVRLLLSEKLNKDSLCDQSQIGRPHFYSYTTAPLPRGRVAQTAHWQPHFSYYGFRYIQVEGAVMKGEPNPEGLPVVEDLQSCFIHSSAKEYSSFEAANPLFTNIHRLIERAERSNMQSVFTDCPHREKLGWLEQDHLCGPSLFYNYDLTTYAPKLIQDICDAQKEDGSVPTIAPQYTVFGSKWGDFDESVEWASTLVIMPFQYYEHYGDNSLILKAYDAMCRYVDYLKTRTDSAGILNFGLGDWYDYQDGAPAGFSKNTPVPLVGTAHYIYDLQLVVRAAEMKKDKLHLNIYKRQLAQAIADFNRRFFNADSCYYGNNSQCSNALPLFLGICPKGTEKRVYANLIADINKTGRPRLTTGDVGNRYLIQTLARHGDNRLVYDMFNHYDTPGYGYQMRRGMTTLSEQWNPDHGSSLNHFMMGQLDEWLFRSMAGIRNADGKVGLTDIIIEPFLTPDNPYVKASTANLHGTISVEATPAAITVEIPANCRATVIAPNGKKTKVRGGKHTIAIK